MKNEIMNNNEMKMKIIMKKMKMKKRNNGRK